MAALLSEISKPTPAKILVTRSFVTPRPSR